VFEVMSSTLMWAALTGFILTVFMEKLLIPRPPLRRPWSCWLLHGGLWCFSLGCLYLLTARPWFSAINVLAVWLLIVLVSNAKYESLREPFVCADFEYFSDAVRFPRLYLPFFGIGKAAGLAVAFIAYLAAGLYFEPRAAGAFGDALVLLVLGGALLFVGHRPRPEPSFNPGEDLCRWGLAASLWRYFFAARQPIDVAALGSPFQSSGNTLPESLALPDMVSIQSESFFDVRRLFDGVKPEVLSEFDRLNSEALCHGQLHVAAWGANTVRTEFAYLCGLDSSALGVHRFNPYRVLARKGLPSIASELKRQGYRTVCIHPYAGSFYGRDKVLPALGFDEFIDVRHFTESQKAGPFIGDCAVADKILELLDAPGRTQPLFIHAITMENHGPLHLEHVSAEELPVWFSKPLSEPLRELGPYVRHIANADRMLGNLRQSLSSSPRATGLCFFGDHVPILPNVYATLGEPVGHTDYFIWSNRSCVAGEPGALPVTQLSTLFIENIQASLVAAQAAPVTHA
jgi:hypothetical protein